MKENIAFVALGLEHPLWIFVPIGVLSYGQGLALPNVTGDAGTMTHYMGLLAANQPWNLLLFMAIPVILAETLAVSELAVLFRQGDVPRWVHLLNRWAGLLIGPWFLGITVYAPAMRNQLDLAQRAPASRAYAGAARRSRMLFFVVTGLVLVIVGLMVLKPSLWAG